MAEEFTAKFKVDISDLKKNIAEAQKSIKVANATFRSETAGMDKWADNADGLGAKLTQLDKVLTSQKSILAAYRKELERQEAAYNENGKRAEELRKKLKELADQGVSKSSEEYKKYKQALKDCLTEQQKNEKATDDLKLKVLDQEAAVKGTEREIRHYNQSLGNLDKQEEEVVKETANANEGFTVLKGTLANLAAEGIKKAISGLKKLGKAAVDAYKDYDTGADNIIKATGATGEAAKELQETYKGVTKKVVGDLGTIGSTLGEVNTRFGFTGSELEDATTAFTKFADITGSDAVSAVRSISRMMEKAGIKSDKYGDILDALAVASQASGISVDDLADKIEKGGTVMQGLGFDTEETIALFAQWEKAGVNTSDAFAGMRKAMGKWAKDGKDAKKEFEKALKVIKDTPDTTKATQKAVEIFGQKAGPELAKAVREGKIEYGDFLKTLKNSKGTVEKTYEATQDGFDKVNLVIQGAKAELGDYISTMMDKYAPQIEAFAKKATDGLKKVFKWVAENAGTLAKFAGAVGAAFAVKKVADFAGAIGKAVGAVKTAAGAVGGLAKAVKILDIGSLVSPVGLVVAAVAGLSAAFVALRKKIEKDIEAEYGLTEQQKLTVQAAKDSKAAYDDMNQARNESMGTIDREYKYINDLKEEYNKLIGSNGKVKKGYEARAEFIKTTLAESLGIERDEIDKLIEKNGKFGESIDAIIQKKQAEAILAANSDAYRESIQKQDEALKIYLESQKTADEAEQKYKATLAETGKERAKISTAMLHAAGNVDQYNYQLSQLDEKERTAKKALEDARQAVEDSEDAYTGYINTISNYEGLSASILSGDAKAINDSMTAITNNLITAKNGTERTLKQQKENAEKTYKDIKAAADRGMAGVTSETVKKAREMYEKSDAELKKFEGVYSKSYKKVVMEAASIQEPLGTLATGAATSFFSNLGSEENKRKTKEAAGGLVSSAVNEAATAQSKMQTEGSNAGGGFISGLASKIGEGIQAAANFVQNIINSARRTQDSNSPSKVWRDQVGKSAGEGYVSGLASMIKPAVATAKSLVDEAMGAAAAEQKKNGLTAALGTYGANISGSVANAAHGLNSGAMGGSGGVVNRGTTLTYNQTINSPKPLTRIEIYRQTKNLLSLAKMGA